MTRIIAGEARGRRLQTPAGDATRPTSDRVREALFSALISEFGTLAGQRFLDVYAGSGAVGLEARSRGASQVVVVEHAPAALAAIRTNIRTLGFVDVEVMTTRAERLSHRSPPGGLGFDIAFFDPPYEVEPHQLGLLMQNLGEAGWFAAEAMLVVERPRRDGWEWPSGVTAVQDRKYGETILWYGRWAFPVSEVV